MRLIAILHDFFCHAGQLPASRSSARHIASAHATADRCRGRDCLRAIAQIQRITWTALPAVALPEPPPALAPPLLLAQLL